MGLGERTPGQRTRPRAFNGVAGTSGAASRPPSYPFTSPKRSDVIQSSLARRISSSVRPTKFHHMTINAHHRRSAACNCWRSAKVSISGMIPLTLTAFV